jgi:hypothetical protein
MPSWNSGSLGSGRITSIRGERRESTPKSIGREQVSHCRLSVFVAPGALIPHAGAAAVAEMESLRSGSADSVSSLP